jgi:Serine dehydrogenase proteinase
MPVQAYSGHEQEGTETIRGHKSARRADCRTHYGPIHSKGFHSSGETPAQPSGLNFRQARREQGWKNEGCQSESRTAPRNRAKSGCRTLGKNPVILRIATHRGGCYLENMAGVFSQIQKETAQAHPLRKPLLEKIRELRGGRAVVSFHVTFYGDFPLHQKDADMLEEILGNTDCSKGVTLILDAPGGDGLAAERMIQICRSYSKVDFETIVPARAKSAATMVCLGSDRILMSPTSELGPVDPQVYVGSEGEGRWMAAHHIVKTYDELFNAAINLQNGQIEPYLQQLKNLNAVDIQELKSQQLLAENIAISSLQRSMMKGKSDDDIRKSIRPFIDPDITMSHGRALNHERASACGLNIEFMDLNSDLWKNVWSIYSRSNFVVDATSTAKLVETVENSY